MKISGVPNVTELVRAELGFKPSQPGSRLRALVSVFCSLPLQCQETQGEGMAEGAHSPPAIPSPPCCPPWVNGRRMAMPTEGQLERALPSSTASSDNDR